MSEENEAYMNEEYEDQNPSSEATGTGRGEQNQYGSLEHLLANYHNLNEDDQVKVQELLKQTI